jgi:mono/diheme cytochrome c family protein
MSQRATFWSGACVVAVAVAAGAFSLSCTKAEAPGTASGTQATNAAAEDPIARGRYLSVIGGCNDCHTPGTLYGAPDTTRLLSGSELGWHGPWGVSYPKNLTPDKETGLGKYTDAEVAQMLRTGSRPDGTPLLPPMPWPNYARLSEADMNALIAYLRSIPAVKHMPPAVVPPTAKFTGPALTFPPPPAWDAPKPASG